MGVGMRPKVGSDNHIDRNAYDLARKITLWADETDPYEFIDRYGDYGDTYDEMIDAVASEIYTQLLHPGQIKGIRRYIEETIEEIEDRHVRPYPNTLGDAQYLLHELDALERELTVKSKTKSHRIWRK